MADLSFLHDGNELTEIDKIMELQNKNSKPRNYLGMSSIGEDCCRKLWLELNSKTRPEFPAQVLRIFRIGNLIEQTIIDDLTNAGFALWGCQEGFSDFNGLFRGHLDSFISGLIETSKPHVLEIKSSNDKNFNLFKKDGIKAHPIYGAKYYAQSQCYMGYSNTDRALFIVENKNNGSRYRERIRFVRKDFEDLRLKAEMIILAKYPPRGISSRPDWFKCKFCNFNDDVSCRKKWSGEPAF